MGALKKSNEKNRLRIMRVDAKMAIIEHDIQRLDEDSGLVRMLRANSTNGIGRQLGGLMKQSQKGFNAAYPGQTRSPVSKQVWETKGSSNVSRLMDLMDLDEL